jgi:hypothetical protein
MVVDSRVYAKPERRERREMVVDEAPTSTISCVLSCGRLVPQDSVVVVAAAAPASSNSWRTFTPVSVAAFSNASRWVGVNHEGTVITASRMRFPRNASAEETRERRKRVVISSGVR